MSPLSFLFALLVSANVGLATNPSVTTSVIGPILPRDGSGSQATTPIHYGLWDPRISDMQVIDTGFHSNISAVLASLALHNPDYLSGIMHSKTTAMPTAGVTLWNYHTRRNVTFDVDLANLKEKDDFSTNNNNLWPTVMLNGLLQLANACNPSICGIPKKMVSPADGSPNVNAVLYAILGKDAPSPVDVPKIYEGAWRYADFFPTVLFSKDNTLDSGAFKVNLDIETLFYVVKYDTKRAKVTFRETEPPTYGMKTKVGTVLTVKYTENNEFTMDLTDVHKYFSTLWQVFILEL